MKDGGGLGEHCVAREIKYEDSTRLLGWHLLCYTALLRYAALLRRGSTAFDTPVDPMPVS